MEPMSIKWNSKSILMTAFKYGYDDIIMNFSKIT